MNIYGRELKILSDNLSQDKYLFKTIPMNSLKWIIDIGANVGLISIMARLLHPLTKILSIEPHEETYARLVENVKNLNIKTANVALGTGEKFYLFKERKTSLCNMFTSEKSELSNFSVDSKTLCDIYHEYKIDPEKSALKIDCEGAEHYILMDIRDTSLLTKIPYINIEVHEMDNNNTIYRFVDEVKNMLFLTHTITIKMDDTKLSCNLQAVKE